MVRMMTRMRQLPIDLPDWVVQTSDFQVSQVVQFIISVFEVAQEYMQFVPVGFVTGNDHLRRCILVTLVSHMISTWKL